MCVRVHAHVCRWVCVYESCTYMNVHTWEYACVCARLLECAFRWEYGFNSSQLGWPSVHLKALRKQSPLCVWPVPFEHSERCLLRQEHSTDPYARALLRYWLLYVTWGLGQLWGCTYFDFSKHYCNFNSLSYSISPCISVCLHICLCIVWCPDALDLELQIVVSHLWVLET